MIGKCMIGVAAAIGLALCAPVCEAGEEAARAALAEELLNLMDMQKTIGDSFAMVKEMLPAQMEQMGASGKAEGQRVNEVLEAVMQQMSWENLKKDYIAIYAETFEADELRGLVEFYKSPAGRKFIAKQPELMRRSMAVSQKQMAALMPRIMELAAPPEAAAPPGDDQPRP